MKSEAGAWVVTRRDFLQAAGAALAGASVAAPRADADGSARPPLRFGLVTDLHYAEAEAKGGRCYRQSAAKLAECVALMNAQQVAFMVELGDLKDQGDPPTEQGTLTYLATIEKVFGQFRGPRYHVLGNHDVDSISKQQFLGRVENTGIAPDATYYAFDAHGLHVVVLDANFNADGSDYDHGHFKWSEAHVPDRELAWLKADLAAATTPVIVCVHQQLDGATVHCVKNAGAVRQLLQASGKVLAVFQGHNHAGGYSRIAGIHYYTLKAVVDGPGVEDNAYAIVEVGAEGGLHVTGYRRAVSRQLTKA